MKISYTLDSYGEMTIKGYKWFDEQPKRGIIVLAHGMAETIERYDALANFLVKNGFVVYGYSHRGHGKTAGAIDKLGIIGDSGWIKMKEDLRRAVDLGVTEYPGLPVFIIGHSMGSFLLRDYLLDYSQTLKGAIISGTGFMPSMLLRLGRGIAAMECKIKGCKHPSKLIDKIAFGRNNKGIKNPITPFDWLSRDASIINAYMKDPFCGQMHTAGFFYEFFDNLLRILYTDSFSQKKENLPLLILSGDSDPVGDYGRGVRRTQSYYEQHGFKTQLKLYPRGRHEMLNEINRLEVFQDILEWLNEQ